MFTVGLRRNALMTLSAAALLASSPGLAAPLSAPVKPRQLSAFERRKAELLSSPTSFPVSAATS